MRRRPGSSISQRRRGEGAEEEEEQSRKNQLTTAAPSQILGVFSPLSFHTPNPVFPHFTKCPDLCQLLSFHFSLLSVFQFS